MDLDAFTELLTPRGQRALEQARELRGTEPVAAATALRKSFDAALVSAALTQAVERLGVIPFDSVLAGTTCTTVSAAPFPHTLCTTVTSISTVSRQATVIVTPTGGDALPPDTAVLVRTDAIRAEPLGSP